MRQMVTLAYYELARLIRQRSVFFLGFVMPLLIILILGSALGTFFVNKPIRIGELRLAVLLEDDGFIRPSLERLLSGGEMGDTRVITVQSKEELNEKVRNGAADAGVSVPAGFSDALRTGGKPEWVFTEGGNAIKGVVALQYLHAFFDGWNQRFAESGSWAKGEIPLDATVTVSDLGGTVEWVKRTGWNDSGKTYTAFQYYSAHMLVMFMLYFAMSAAVSMVTAKEDHTLSRMLSMPVPAWRILTGNLAGQSTLMAAQAAFIVLGSAMLFGADWGNHPGLLSLTIFLVMVFGLSTAVICSILTGRRQQVIAVYQSGIIIMTFLAGGFSPSIGETLTKVGSYTMSYRAVQSMLRMMLGEDTAAIWGDIRILAWYALGAAVAATAVFRKAGYHE